MDENHQSLHFDFEDTGPEPHAAIALVETPAVEAFVETMTERFEAPVDQPSTEPPAFHVVWPVQGAHVVQPSA